jgi:2-C-methyl-D-erythritol 4-phosphate cytidylyltransferase
VRGRTLLDHACSRFAEHPDVRDVIVVLPAPFAANVPGAVAGGATRQDSVHAGIAALAPDVDIVLVHDVARPFVPAAVISRVIAAVVAGADAVVPVLPVADTVKRVDAAANIVETLDRSQLRIVQTPQGFRRSTLAAAHRIGLPGATDDAALVEAMGGRVIAVDGAEEAFKITRPWDLRVAEAVAR